MIENYVSADDVADVCATLLTAPHRSPDGALIGSKYALKCSLCGHTTRYENRVEHLIVAWVRHVVKHVADDD